MDYNNFESKSAQEILLWAKNEYGQKAGLASSFGMEDMVLIDLLVGLQGDITIFTLDTGRLHEETYEVMERARSKYGVTIKAYFPDKEKVEAHFDEAQSAVDMAAKKNLIHKNKAARAKSQLAAARKAVTA